MRHLFVVLGSGLGLALGGQVAAATASASFGVSAIVQDQCVVRTATRSAMCTGDASYALTVARESVPMAESSRLTTASEHAHTRNDGPLYATSQLVAGAQGDMFAAVADRSVAPATGQLDAIQVTYSF